MSHIPSESDVMEYRIQNAAERGEICEGCLKSPYVPNNDCEVTAHPLEESEEDWR